MVDPRDRYANGLLGFDGPTELLRLRTRERLIDRDTMAILSDIGIGDAWRCLELGAGTGSIAAWLAGQCRDGQVVATDIDIRYLEQHQLGNLQVRQHDVTTDSFPPAAFDLVHTRSLLVNLPERDAVLDRIVGWAAPGGWLVIEEPAIFPIDSSSYPAYQRLMRALEQVMAISHGADMRWPRRLPALLTASGVTDIGMRVTPQYVGDGGFGEDIWRVALLQTRSAILDAGLLTAAEFAEGLALFDDVAFLDMAVAMMSVWGRKPSRLPVA
ncbi:methyltransferase domain-containing protein [Nocardia colli]|uniref:Methyltransferase domain-containing protein n=1 Tax=Nocardia colli TaxID=2545717 RepID=A0A5N0EBB9_9NOCA|nr:class I SAM-dependent methyltransferase [Nocardia colli]KAA8886243.1 methyltransferase domain-containing protein [Nocardia colli]